jgi:four helix bundle protein
MLSHERLDVYKLSIAFADLAFKLVAALPNGKDYGPLADQLRRAAVSVPLNIAEGSGRFTDPDRVRFFSIARGSAMECGAILDIVALGDGGHEELLDEGKALLRRIVALLTKMARRTAEHRASR